MQCHGFGVLGGMKYDRWARHSKKVIRAWEASLTFAGNVPSLFHLTMCETIPRETVLGSE